MPKMTIFLKPKILIAVAAVVVVSVGAMIMSRTSELTSLDVYYPFVFSQEISPSNIVTVGDQVACEHVYAFHSFVNSSNGFSSLFSNIDFDYENNLVTLRKNYPVYDVEGNEVSYGQICSTIQNIIKGTSHATLAPLVEKVDCATTAITIYFKQIPNNLKYLLTLADFSIFYPEKLPLTSNRLGGFTGPYGIKSFSETEIELQINKYYPKDLRANTIPNVKLHSYYGHDSFRFIEQITPEKEKLVYIYGYLLTNEILNSVRKKGYHVRQMPSEWMIYFGLNESIRDIDRMVIAKELIQIKNEMLQQSALGQPAYSLSPSDRPYGSSAEEYDKMVNKSWEHFSHTGSRIKSDKRYILATLDEWAQLPIFKVALEEIQKRLNNYFEIKLFARKDIYKIWSNEVDAVLSPMGIAPADPINNIAFMTEYRDLISMTEINEAAILFDPYEFNKKVKALEQRLVFANRFVPIAHFPGIVLEAPGVTRDANISWSWGIQAWTYTIH